MAACCPSLATARAALGFITHAAAKTPNL